MKPAEQIETELLTLEGMGRMNPSELDKFAQLLDGVVMRANEVWTDEALWPEGVAENPLTREQLNGYFHRLLGLIEASDDPRFVEKLVRPVRRLADKDFKGFLISSLRKWIDRDDLVVYQLILGLHSIGEKPWPLGRTTIDPNTLEGRKLYRSDAREYLQTLDGQHATN